jgi:hypothetical protein
MMMGFENPTGLVRTSTLSIHHQKIIFIILINHLVIEIKQI